jgi:hypothetical protein
MEATQIAYVAGFMTGRGGFGLNKAGWKWFYFRTLDPEIARSTRDEWGGVVTERVDNGTTSYKYTVTGEPAAKAIADVAPYLIGLKREGAENCSPAWPCNKRYKSRVLHAL